MSIMMLLKIFSDCCICFGILGFGPVQFTVPLLVPALICGISAAIASFFQEKGKKVLRKLCALLPFGGLLLASSGQQGLVLAIPVLYTAFVILRGKLELEYYTYRRFFLRSLFLVGGAYVLVNVWVFLSQALNDPLPPLDTGVMLRYGLVHTMCGIVLQRQLRLGVGYRSEGGRRQLSMLLVAALVIIVAFLAAEPLLRQSAAGFITAAVSVIGTPFLLIVQFFSWILGLFQKKKQEEPPNQSSVSISGEGAVSSPAQQQEQTVTELPQAPADPTYLWIILVVILLVLAVLILLRSFQKRKAPGDPGELGSRMVIGPKKRKTPALSNRNRVRQLYREFLRVENGSGLKLKPCDTSEDVLRRIRPETDRQSAEQLRQVYLAARYDDRQSISRAQVAHAKRALKGTRAIKT